MDISATDLEIKWEYFVLQINIDNKKVDIKKNTNPQLASDKLKGSLSPDFLKKQFPDQYQEKTNEVKDANVGLQLQTVLNKVGEGGWELVESTSLANLFLFIFKKAKKVT